MKNNRTNNMLYALIGATVFWALMIAVFYLTSKGTTVNRISIALGGNILGGGYIQYITYFIFLLGIIEIRNKLKEIDRQELTYKMKLLPEDEHKVLSPDDLVNLKHKMIQIEQGHNRFFMTDLIKKACTKFRANQSIPEVLETVIRQSQLNYQAADSSQSLIRYLVWAIPSVGFVGTIIGIAGGIGSVKGKMSPELIDKVTALLGVAFDTTLIALLLSIVLMYFIHTLEEKEEKLHNGIEQYVISNLVNRIFVK